ncbi:hypothetical protein RCH12_002963 [Cryobacterium sp. MP_3.1]|uniref:hypothetical protein n=1 Tax=Cryobacterium sp. MP_3.1 TaxID=3071711 RepID=UPI002E06F66F|nr:hypothetical protein [Cryobacterium sp. MP_3.1]
MKKAKAFSGVVRDFWIDHLWVDSAVALGLVALHAALVTFYPVTDVFGNAQPADRRAVYSSAAIVVSLLGSFSGVAIGQLGSAKGARTTALKKQGGQILARNWQSIFRTAMLAALVALMALLIDPSVPSAGWGFVLVRWVFEFALLLAILKFVRLSSLFFEVINLTTQEAAEAEEKLAEAPRPNPNWGNRRAS